MLVVNFAQIVGFDKVGTFIFLAVQDSSIGDIVTHSLNHSLSESLLILASSEHCRLLRDFWETFERLLRDF